MMASRKPSRIVALEEAFLHPEVRVHYDPAYLALLDLLKDRHSDVGPERIRRMDAAGIDMQVLSHVAPGVQTLERATAIRLACTVNDWLADVVRAHPTRFAGFATLPMQAPQEAADELERAMTQLGFKGALVNGHTGGRYLDDPVYEDFLARAERLGAPIYIHPTDPPPAVAETYYGGHPVLVTGGWGWQVETGTHLLRLISGGVFDRHPGLRVIVGHMGELIPYNLARINTALTLGSWILANRDRQTVRMQRSFKSYLRTNVYITTSGVFDQAAFDCALAGVGIDNLLFSVDDPFADNIEAVAFLNATRLSDEDRDKLAHGNADRLLGFGGELVGRTNGGSLERRSSSALYRWKAKLKARMAKRVLSFLVS